MRPDPLDKEIAALDRDHRKLYPKADLPPVAFSPPPAQIVAPPAFYIPGPNGEFLQVDPSDVDRLIQVSILEELRGLRADMGHLYNQMIEVETAVQNSTR